MKTKQQNERNNTKSPRIVPPFRENVNQGVWNNLDESARSSNLKFQKLQKSLIKGIIVIVFRGEKADGQIRKSEGRYSKCPYGCGPSVGKCQPGVKLSTGRADKTSAQYKL